MSQQKIQEYIEKVIESEDLTVEEAEEAVGIAFEEATDAQIGALLTALRMKGETEEEIAGFAIGMKKAARRINPDTESLIDTCGTGGDRYDTINVSTASAVTAAATGANVAKHGNYSVSSSSGSADVLEELGAKIDAEPPRVQESIEEIGIGFMLAPVFHPAMANVIGPRKELATRTVFNVLGPLTNPADADSQIVGVFSEDIVELIGEVLSIMDVEHALVVHGDGIDEIGLHSETTIAEVRDDSVENYTLNPSEIGLETADIQEVSGGSPIENAEILRGVFSGDRTGPRRDIIAANTGAALYIAGIAGSIEEGVEIALNTLDEGRALDKLDEMVEFNG